MGLKGLYIVQLNVFLILIFWDTKKNIHMIGKKSKGKKSDLVWATQSVARREPSCIFSHLSFFLR